MHGERSPGRVPVLGGDGCFWPSTHTHTRRAFPVAKPSRNVKREARRTVRDTPFACAYRDRRRRRRRRRKGVRFVYVCNEIFCFRWDKPLPSGFSVLQDIVKSELNRLKLCIPCGKHPQCVKIRCFVKCSAAANFAFHIRPNKKRAGIAEEEEEEKEANKKIDRGGCALAS